MTSQSSNNPEVKKSKKQIKKEERRSWSEDRRRLRTVSIFNIVFSSCMIVFLGAVLAALMALFSSGVISQGLGPTENVNVAYSADEIAQAFLYAIFMQCMLLLAGIFGIRGAKNPKKIMSVFFLSFFYNIFMLSGLVNTVANDHDITSNIFSIVMMCLPAYMCYLAWRIRVNREDLNGELPGNDGTEYPDGFNPKKLGLMWFLMVIFAINIIVTVLSLTVLVKGQYELSFTQLLDLLNLIFEGVLFYMIWKRYAVTRKVAVIFALFNIIVGTGFNLLIGDFNAETQVSLCFFDLLILFYFLFSRRAEAILTVKLTKEGVVRHVEKEEEFFKPKTWAFWRSIIVYFCIFCVMGHWMEAGYCTFIKWGILPGIYDPTSQIWSDWLYPFPVYGIGFVACALAFYPIKNWLQKRLNNKWSPLLISFVINALVCTGIELVLGLTQNQPVNGVYPLWDYSNMFCNFMGQICLQNALAFGFAATIITWVVYPFLEQHRLMLDNNVCNVIFVVVVVFFAILMGLYLVKLTLPGEITGTLTS